MFTFEINSEEALVGSTLWRGGKASQGIKRELGSVQYVFPMFLLDSVALNQANELDKMHVQSLTTK